MLKLVTLTIPWILMFVLFINTKIRNKNNLVSLCKSSSIILPTSPFIEENILLSSFLRINMNPIPFGEKTKPQFPSPLQHRADPAMINQNYLLQIFVTADKTSNNKNI